jgi:hypothetical protein
VGRRERGRRSREREEERRGKVRLEKWEYQKLVFSTKNFSPTKSLGRPGIVCVEHLFFFFVICKRGPLRLLKKNPRIFFNFPGVLFLQFQQVLSTRG